MLRSTTMTCGIYMLRNTVNSRVYIGQSVNIEARWKRHVKNTETGVRSKLYAAMRKYGTSRFDLQVLHVTDNDPSVMDSLEVAEIQSRNSIRDGYNDAEGGLGGRLSEAARKRIGKKTRQYLLRAAETGEHPAQKPEKREMLGNRLRMLAAAGRHPAQSENARRSLSMANRTAYEVGRSPLIEVNAVDRCWVTDGRATKRIVLSDREKFLQENHDWRRGRPHKQGE